MKEKLKNFERHHEFCKFLISAKSRINLTGLFKMLNQNIWFKQSAQLLSISLSMREVWDSNPGPVKSDSQCRQRLATSAISLRNCVVQALKGRDGSRRSLHVLTQHHEYNEDLIFLNANSL